MTKRSPLFASLFLCSSLLSPIKAEPCPQIAAGPPQTYRVEDTLDLYRETSGLGRIARDFGDPDSRRWARLSTSLGVPVPENLFPYGCHYGYAERVLADLRQRLGDQHPYIHAWLKNRNRVFSACGGYDQALEPPPADIEGVGPDLAERAKADLAYERAAYDFYAASYKASGRTPDQLKDEFAAIAADRGSPHRPAAAYMLALIDFRRNVGIEQRAEPVLRQVERLLADPEMAPVHRIARQLRDAVAYESAAPDLLLEQAEGIGKAVSRPRADIDASPDFRGDYDIAAEDLGWFVNSAVPPAGPRGEALRQAAARWPALGWLSLMAAAGDRATIQGWLQGDEKSPYDPLKADAARHAADGSLLWTVAALGLADPQDKGNAQLLSVAERQQRKLEACALPAPEAVLEPDLLIQSVRLRLMSGDVAGALAALDLHAAKMPAAGWQPAAKLAAQWLILQDRLDEARHVLALFPPRFFEVTALRELVARDFGEFRAAVSQEDATYQGSPTATVLSLLPTARLAEFAADKEVPESWQVLAARVAWTRSYLLGGAEAARKMSPLLASLDPVAGPQLKKFDRAGDPAQSRHLAALLLARMPGMHIDFGYYADWSQPRQFYADAQGTAMTLDRYDHSDGNWWCPMDVPYDRDLVGAELFYEPLGLERDDPARDALRRTLIDGHPVLKLADPAELDRLAAVPSAPRLLSETAVEWAKSSNWWSRLRGRDRALPEMLALAVRSTHYGCQRAGGHGAYSRAAYEELHKRYPRSERSKATPFWYDCGHFRLGCAGPYSMLDPRRRHW